MASARVASVVRLALIDDDSGLETVLQRRLRALGWDATSLGYAAAPEELAALRLHLALVNPEELVARIEAVLRRRRSGDLPMTEEPIAAGELEIRPDRFDAYGNGRPAALSRKEFELLRLLATADGRVLEREDIYQRVWGYTMARGDRSVDVFVRKLRHKLDAVSPRWTYVHTHFGVGYRFAAQPPDGAGREDRPARARGEQRTLVM